MRDGKGKSKLGQQGFSTLLFTMVVLVSVTLFSFVSADAVVGRQHAIVSYHQIQSSFNAAQAGLDYGLTYLDQNRETINDGDTVSGSLSDGSTYNVTYTFQGGSNELVQITSTSASASGESTRQIKQLVKYVGDGGSSDLVSQPVISRGAVSLTSLSTVSNNHDGAEGASIRSGDAVDFSSFSRTAIDGVVSSYSGNIENDVSTNDFSLSAMSDSDMEAQALGYSIDTLVSDATAITLSGLHASRVSGGQIYVIGSTDGAPIDIGQSRGNITIGSPSNPATLIVDGDLNLTGSRRARITLHGNLIVRGDMNLSGRVTVNGLVFVENSSTTPTLSSGVRVNGAIISANDTGLNVERLSRVTYRPNLVEAGIATLNAGSSSSSSLATGSYGKVSGSWVDLSP